MNMQAASLAVHWDDVKHAWQISNWLSTECRTERTELRIQRQDIRKISRFINTADAAKMEFEQILHHQLVAVPLDAYFNSSTHYAQVRLASECAYWSTAR